MVQQTLVIESPEASHEYAFAVDGRLEPSLSSDGGVDLRSRSAHNVVGAALTAGVLSICNNAGRGVWVYWSWAGHVWCTGP